MKINGKYITEEEIRDDFKKAMEDPLSFTWSESKTYQLWMSLAEDWLSCGDNDYLEYGFRGFFERDIETIIEDFRFNDEEGEYSYDPANKRSL